MMAARRTLIVTQTIYTKAERLKGMQTEEAGHRANQLVKGAEICVFEVLLGSYATGTLHVQAADCYREVIT